MIKAAAVHHLAAVAAGLLAAWLKQDWTLIAISLSAQGFVLFFRFVVPDWFGLPDPRAQAAEIERQVERRLAKLAIQHLSRS